MTTTTMRRRRAPTEAKNGSAVPDAATTTPTETPPSTTAAANDFRRRDESPRQVISGAALLLSLIWIARDDGNDDAAISGASSSPPPPGASFRRASLGVLLTLATYCFLNTRDGPLRNPHPGFWRMLHGSTLWYALTCAILLVVRPDDGVRIFGWLFPHIERTERGPMEGVGANDGATLVGMDHLDCEITPENLRRQVFGLWFFAHAVGWWAKMLMLRDWGTCLVYSTAFELVELTLQCLVPEFQECWWDSAILDWLVANLLLGMNLGVITRRWLNVPSLRWSRDSPRAAERPVLTRIPSVATPTSWIEYDWNPDNDPFSLLLNSVIWVLMCVGEVNSFFLINILQLPRDHAFNILRQVFFCLAALPACEEWYEYTRHVRVYNTGRATKEYREKYLGRKPRIGQTVWLLAVAIGLETAAVVKYGLALGLFANARTFDARYWGPWAAAAASFLGYLGVHCRMFYGGARRYPRWLGVWKWGSALPLLLLCRLYAF